MLQRWPAVTHYYLFSTGKLTNYATLNYVDNVGHIFGYLANNGLKV